MAQSAGSATQLKNSKAEWEEWFIAASIPAAEANQYATLCVQNRITRTSDLTRDILRELGITIIGDIIAITNHNK